MKTLSIALLLTATSVFALHPLSDYTECQQPYIEELRNGSSRAFKESIVGCRARLWNEDMSSYSNFNYKKFTATSLTCAGDLHAREVLSGHSQSLRYAATFYRIAATKNNQDAKVNLVYLSKEGNKVIFLGDTKIAYTKVFDDNLNTKTFIQIVNGVKNVKKNDQNKFLNTYKQQLIDYTASCVSSLEKDLLMVKEEEQKLNNDFFQTLEAEKDKEFEKYFNIWGNIEDRNFKAQINIFQSSLKDFKNMHNILKNK